MIPARNQPDPEELKSLVAEQQGLLWSLFGLFLALFIGLGFRATFSPEKITGLLQDAAANIHPEVKVTFARASLSLSDGLFPELAVVVEEISATSEQECWMKPSLRIDALRLPLQVKELFLGEVRLATVDVANAELHFRSDRSGCREGGRGTASEPGAREIGTAPGRPASGTVDAPLEVTVTERNPVENVLIRSLRVLGPRESWIPFEIRRLSLRADPRERTLSSGGTILLPVDGWSGGASQGDFNIEYQGRDSQKLSYRLSGFWREGRYLLSGEADLASRRAGVSFEAQHLPLHQVLEFLRRRGLVDRPFNARQAWVSFKARSPGLQSWETRPQLRIQELKVEGDLGDVRASEIVLNGLSPVTPEPFTMALRGVRLEKLFSFLELESPSPVLADLGTFNGELRFRDLDRFELAGEHSGLQFIFSNRGSRELQTMSLIAGRARFERDTWQVDLDQIRPLEGLFLGSVRLKADRPWRKVAFHLEMDELTLAPGVQRLMTGGGSLGRWNGALDMRLDGGRLQDLKARIEARELLVENLAVDRGLIQISSPQEILHIDVSGKGLRLSEPSPLLEVLRPLFGTEAPYAADQLRLQLESRDFEHLKWRLWPVKVGALTLRSEGGWNERGELEGRFTRRDPGGEQIWRVEGTREAPRLERVEAR